MTLGFVLINVENGKESTLKKMISKVAEVKEVHLLYGEYDMIVSIESADATSIARIVVDKIRHLEGVRVTRTHIAVKG